ncbi:MAG: VOC family protein [Ktedonobacteraceae bacterium]|nr:VOC family protein [Ktedonobacteraceae bacterium]
MNILTLDHASLLVQDVNRSRQFYCQVLGMEEVPSGGNCWLRKAGAEIHLLRESKQGDASPSNASRYPQDALTNGYVTHIAFEVDDLDAAQRHLKNQHVHIVCGPRPRWNGGAQLYFCDPDGYVIELFVRKAAV